MYREAEVLVKKLINLFGVDSNNLGNYSMAENYPGMKLYAFGVIKILKSLLDLPLINGGNCFCLDTGANIENSIIQKFIK